jgi:restriction system protein
MTQRCTWRAEIFHKGLMKSKVITGETLEILELKVQIAIDKWHETWTYAVNKQLEGHALESHIQEAAERTEEAKQQIEELSNILKSGLALQKMDIWKALKDRMQFNTPEPEQPPEPEPPRYASIPPPPDPNHPIYQPQFSFLDSLSSSRRAEKIQEAQRHFQWDYNCWNNERIEIEKKNIKRKNDYISKKNEWKHNYQTALKKWNKEKQDFEVAREKEIKKIDSVKKKYENKEPSGVIKFVKQILLRSVLPSWIQVEFESEYRPENGILIIDYQLPSNEAVPKLKEVKYIKSTGMFKEILMPESAINNLYDEMIYQLTLRVLHEIFREDDIGIIQAIALNGRVKSIDKKTGHPVNSCILSIEVKRDEILKISLANVEPKACFKNLKGIGSSKLHSMTPVAPIIALNREDKRFIPGYNVVDGIDEGENIAIMDWEDFEHLVREIFEKEFVTHGGEVKITQASRDGGVDAVAFDPDPIRGGKIVIQAKRYTNTVGVSAVRDLYGTLMNEGATKGILVTTSDYGPDAYEFAKDKPITLLNGGNLLHLLEKHGYKARIDLNEAKKILAESPKK